MTTPLFYRKVVPLDKSAHRELFVDAGDRRFDFARGANLIPAVVDEFGSAMQHLPIAFLPGTRHPSAVFVVGLEPGSNLFLDEDGRWNGGYVPAYLRRFPFIVGDLPSGESLLCVDEAHPRPEGGERLFSAAGEPEPALARVRDLAVDYKRSADRTDLFCTQLQRLGLFTSVSLSAKTAGGGNSVVHGLWIVDEAAFDMLKPDDVKELHELRLLKPIVQHLASLATVSKLGDRSQKKPAKN